MDIDQKYIKECFLYIPESGKLIWKERPEHHFHNIGSYKSFNTSFAGKEAGNKSLKRYTLGISGKTYLANRIAAIYLGIQIDDDDVVICIDGDTYNIKQRNLFVTDKRSRAILRESLKNNPNKCIYKRPNGKFMVSIKIRGRILYGGVYDCLDDAKCVRHELFKRLYI